MTGVGVEKLLRAKFAKIKSCQDAPQTTFSVFLDIFYPPNSCCSEETGVFQQPHLSSRAFGPRKLMKVAQSLFPIGCAGAENRLSTLITSVNGGSPFCFA